MKKIFNLLLVGMIVIFVSGCAKTSLEMVKLESTSLQDRQLQSKNFDTTNEEKILTASVSTLQDMGFNIDEINRDFGVVTSSKVRDAREVGQQVGLFFLALLGGAGAMDLADHTQVIRATIVTTPKEGIKSQTAVRMTVMRVIKNHKGMVTKVETIKDKEIYVQFFDKLSKSVFLEEQKI